MSKYGTDKHLLKVTDILKERRISFIVITSKQAKDLSLKTPYVLYGIIHEEFESLKDMIFYISLKYIFNLFYTILISNDLKHSKELDNLYGHIFNQES